MPGLLMVLQRSLVLPVSQCARFAFGSAQVAFAVHRPIDLMAVAPEVRGGREELAQWEAEVFAGLDLSVLVV